MSDQTFRQITATLHKFPKQSWVILTKPNVNNIKIINFQEFILTFRELHVKAHSYMQIYNCARRGGWRQ